MCLPAKIPPIPQEKIPPAVVGFVWPAASPIKIILLKENFFKGPPIHIGAYIFLITEYFELKLSIKDSNVLRGLIFLPAIPILALPSPLGIIQAKKSGYFILSNLTMIS